MNKLESSIKSPENSQEKLKRRRSKFEQYLELVEDTQSYAFRIIALIFLVCVEIALFVAVFYDKNPSAGLVTAITIIAVLPILVIRVFDISVLNLSKDGIQTEMLQTKMDEMLSTADRLFALTMSEPLYGILEKLDGSIPVDISLNEEKRGQLFYLENIGYIEFTSNALPEGEVKIEELQKHAKVTETGKDFLKLRSRVPKV